MDGCHQQPVAAFNHFGYYPDPREIPGDLLDLPENYYSTRIRYKLRRVAGGDQDEYDGVQHEDGDWRHAEAFQTLPVAERRFPEHLVWGLGFGVWGLEFGVLGLWFWVLGFGFWGLGFVVWGLSLGFEV